MCYTYPSQQTSKRRPKSTDNSHCFLEFLPPQSKNLLAAQIKACIKQTKPNTH